MKKFITLLTVLLMMSFAASAQILGETLDLINKDSIKNTVQHMENFVSRRCNQTVGQNKKVAQYLIDRLKTYGIEDAHIDSFLVSIPNHWLAGPVNQYMYNVLGTLQGTGATDSTVIIGAHLDAIAFTMPNYILTETAPGANDNASGCAVMLEMARIIYENNLKPYYNIDFMAYDAEEIGLYGSYYDAGKRRAANENIIVMLNNDVVAYEPDVNWGAYLVGHNNALDLREKARQAFVNYTAVAPLLSIDGADGSSDNHPYFKNGYKAVRFVGKNYSAFPHSENDVSTILNFEFCRQIARANFVLIADYAGINSLQNNTQNYTLNDINIDVFPVPAKEFIRVHNYNDITIYKIDIYDFSGRLMKSVQNINPQQNIIPLNNLSSGLYFMKIYTDKGIITKKFIKE